MKKFISLLLIFALMLFALAGLTSCDEKDYGDGALYAEMLKADKAASASDDFIIRIWISDSEELSSSSAITIQLSEGLFSFANAESDGTITAKYTDFSVKKNANRAYKDYEIKYNDPKIYDGCAFGNITVSISVESEGGVITEKSNFIGFAALNDYVAFSNDETDSYISICKKLPGWENMHADSSNPLEYTIAPISIESLTYNNLVASIELLDRVPVGNRFGIDIGFIAEHKDRKDGVLTVEADGFSISDANDKDCDGIYEANYTDLDTGKYGFSGGLERKVGYNVYRVPEFNYTENLSFVCKDMTKRSGEIHISFSTDEEAAFSSGYADLDIYYATNGKYIAYSVVSADAAKRELYGDFGYFWNVSVPEFFDDLFDGCD